MSPDENPGANGAGNLRGELKDVVNADQDGTRNPVSTEPEATETGRPEDSAGSTKGAAVQPDAPGPPEPSAAGEQPSGSAAAPGPATTDTVAKPAEPAGSEPVGSEPAEDEPAEGGAVGAAAAKPDEVGPDGQTEAEKKPGDAAAKPAEPEHGPGAAAVAAGAGAVAAGAAAVHGHRSGRDAAEPAPADQARTNHRHAAPASAPAKTRRSAGAQTARALRRLLKLIATLVRLIGVVAAVILVVYVIFIAGHANPANYLTAFVSGWAHQLNLGLDTLFTPKDALLAVVVDYGIAAILWLVVTGLVARILRRL